MSLDHVRGFILRYVVKVRIWFCIKTGQSRLVGVRYDGSLPPNNSIDLKGE